MDMIFNNYTLQILTMVCINIIIVLGLNLITGVTGQLSLGHAAFMSIGAYTSAILVMRAGLPFWVAVPSAMFVSGMCGFLLGLPILRLRGDYLAIATLGFCEIVRVLFLNINITRGALGINGIPQDTTPLLAVILAIATIVFMYNIENSRFGLALRSVREDELASELMGVNIAKYKMIAFAIGSSFAGLGGALYAHQITYISPADFGFMKSIEQISMLVLGGMGSIVGSVAGAAVLSSVPEILRFASEFRMVTYGIVLVLIMVFRPQGLFGRIRVNL